MSFKTDIEIAQEVTPLKITEVAKSCGVDEKYIEQYGNYKAKIDYNMLKETDAPDGKLILVTAITPTPVSYTHLHGGPGRRHGAAGLIRPAVNQYTLNKEVILCNRESWLRPSLWRSFAILRT